MREDTNLPRPENLGSGPERRMENFPRQAPDQDGLLGGAPGPCKPPSADAVGDDDTVDLAENTDGETIRVREKDTESMPAAKPPEPRDRAERSNPGRRSP